MKTVAIVEGFAGGPRNTRGFRKSLADAGFRVIKNRRTADIIVAHSAGIYAIPKDSQAKLVMLIGPTYWPGRRTIMVRNENDAYSGGALKEAMKDAHVRYVELPGIHDDYYENPKPYIDLLLREI